MIEVRVEESRHVSLGLKDSAFNKVAISLSRPITHSMNDDGAALFPSLFIYCLN